MKQRSRRAVLTGVAAFLASQLLLGALIETRWSILRNPVQTLRTAHLQRQLQPHPHTPRSVVCLGTSRFEWGIQTRVLEPRLRSALGESVVVANWGRGGWGLFRSLLAWKRLEREGVRPNLVLVEVLPSLLNKRHQFHETTELMLPTNELDADDLDLVLRYESQRPCLREQRLLAAVFPAYGQRFNLLRLTAPWLVPREIRNQIDVGHDSRSTLVAGQRDRLREAMRRSYETTLREFEIGGVGCQALRELLDSLRSAGVPAALVVMPEGPVFRSWYGPTTWPQVQRHLEDLAAEYGIPWYNLREWFEEEGFSDSHHLLAEAADVFSERLGRDVLLPLLRRE